MSTLTSEVDLGLGKSDRQVAFINRYGLDTFLLVKACYETVPLTDRPQYRKEFLKILFEEYGKRFVSSENELDTILRECSGFEHFCYVPDKTLVLLPPNYIVYPRGCTYNMANGTKRDLVAVSHSPTFARVYEISGSVRRVREIKRRCRGCFCVLEYDMLFSNGRFQFYPKPQPYVRITPSCYFSRVFCEHIVRTMVYGRSTFDIFAELWMKAHKIPVFNRKWISTSFYRHEIKSEIREGPGLMGATFLSQNGFDELLPFVERQYASNGFPHLPSARCAAYKCTYFFVVDAIWSVNFSHCAAPVEVTINGYPHLNLPQVCTNQPNHRSLYCELHSALADLSGVPVTSCHLAELRQTVTPDELQSMLSTPDLSGLFLAMAKSSSENLSFDESVHFRCNKNLGSRRHKEITSGSAADGLRLGISLQPAQVFPKSSPRSRGYLLISRPCGHIIKAVRSTKSPSQVFLTVLSSLYLHVKQGNIPVEDWKKIFVVYDNDCNLDRIQTAKRPLPLPAPFDRLWLEINKVIDVFHLSNHKRPECKTIYHPKNILIVHPDLKKRNTEVAEQNFSWMKRFKPVLNSVPRNRQLFYLFRLIRHRNLLLSERQSV